MVVLPRKPEMAVMVGMPAVARPRSPSRASDQEATADGSKACIETTELSPTEFSPSLTTGAKCRFSELECCEDMKATLPVAPNTLRQPLATASIANGGYCIQLDCIWHWQAFGAATQTHANARVVQTPLSASSAPHSPPHHCRPPVTYRCHRRRLGGVMCRR